jgi:hypothetical protein
MSQSACRCRGRRCRSAHGCWEELMGSLNKNCSLAEGRKTYLQSRPLLLRYEIIDAPSHSVPAPRTHRSGLAESRSLCEYETHGGGSSLTQVSLEQ